jgi:putative ABC transport system permease protein
MPLLLRDFLIGLRSLRRAPGFAAIAILTMALGVGATSAIYAIVNGVLLNGLPWKDPATIVSFELRRQKKNAEPRPVTPAQYRDFKAQTRSFADLCATRWEQVYLTDREEPKLAIAPRVTPNGFALLGIKPLHGRVLVPSDARPDAAPAAMLAERLWRTSYGADPSLVGGTVELNGQPVTVVGIVRSDQWFPWPDAEVVLPLDLDGAPPSRTDERLGVFGRLGPGVSLAQAQSEIDVVMKRLSLQYPETDADLGAKLFFTRERITNESGRRGLVVLMGAVGFVLLIVCANLANLLLSRAATREREIATRTAIGASRGQIVAQLLAECAAIGLVALPIALLITKLCIDYFLSLVPPGGQWMDQFFRFDRNVLAFALLTAFSTVLLCGLSPALKASKLDLGSSLKDGGGRGATDAGSHRMRSALVVLQIGLSLSLLVVASLFMQSFVKIHRIDPGFRLAGAAQAAMALPDSRYGDAAKLRAFHARLTSALSDLPGEAQVAVTNNAPLNWNGPWRDFTIAGQAMPAHEEAPRARWTSVSPGYFATLGLTVLTGRGFAANDGESAQPVAVVSRMLADQFFPGQNPIGRRIALRALEGMGAVTGGERTIVGVVSDVKSFGGLAAPRAEARIYEPLAQQPVNSFSLVLRAHGDPLALGTEIQQRLKRIDPRVSLAPLETMDQRMDRQLWQSNFFVTLMSILGGVALVLAVVGVYGVVSYTTARRTRELGIRAALGAEPRDLATLVLRRTLALATWGVGLGLLLTFLLSRGIQSMLYETSARDPLTVLGLSFLLGLVTLAAGAVPTLRATRVNPMECLRVE